MRQRRSSAGRRYTKRAKGFTLPSILFPADKVVLTTASTLSARCPGSRRHTAWWSMSEAKRTDPRQWEVAQEWLDRADGDLRIAEILLSEAPDLPWGAAFHCQQALEKMAKGVLIAERVEPPKTHDIDVLGRLVGSREPDIPSETDLLAAFAKLRE